MSSYLAYAGGIIIGVLLVIWFVVAVVTGCWNILTWRNRHGER